MTRSNSASIIVSSELVKGRFKSTSVGHADATKSTAVGTPFLKDDDAVRYHMDQSTVKTDRIAQNIRGIISISRPLKLYMDVPTTFAYI